MAHERGGAGALNRAQQAPYRSARLHQSKVSARREESRRRRPRGSLGVVIVRGCGVSLGARGKIKSRRAGDGYVRKSKDGFLRKPGLANNGFWWEGGVVVELLCKRKRRCCIDRGCRRFERGETGRGGAWGSGKDKDALRHSTGSKSTAWVVNRSLLWGVGRFFKRAWTHERKRPMHTRTRTHLFQNVHIHAISDGSRQSARHR